jgi:hypothetical protein
MLYALSLLSLYYIRVQLELDHPQLQNIPSPNTMSSASQVPTISLKNFDERRSDIIEELMDASMNVGFL